MVWVLHVEIAGERQPNSFYLTAGSVEVKREISVGRPPAKSDVKPDIVVPEKSVSKIHALLTVEADRYDSEPHNRLLVTDRSRFGTSINGQKMPAGGSQQLHAGDRIQLAPKTFLMIEERPLDIAVHPHHPRLEEARMAAYRSGARLIHMFGDPNQTHVLYGAGDPVWSALAHGVMRGAPLVDLAWLQQVAAEALWVDALPEPPRFDELQLGPAHPPLRVPLPPPDNAAAQGLRGLTLGFSSHWRDPGLAALLADMGGRVVSTPQESGHPAASCRGSAAAGVLVVVDKDHGGPQVGGGDLRQTQALDVAELLVCILTSDAATLRRDLTARLHALAATEAAATTATAAKVAPEPADSDITQAAEDEDADDAAGEVAQPRQTVPAVTVKVESSAAGPGPHRLGPAGHAAGAGPGSGVISGGDDWMVVARRPEEPASRTLPAGQHQRQPQPEEGDGPRPKRRRIDPPLTLPTAASPSTISRQLLSVPQADRRTAPPGPTQPPALTHPPEAADVPWMTQQPHGRSVAQRGATGSKTSPTGNAAPASSVPPAAVKPEPLAPPTAARPTKSRAKGAKAGAADGFEVTLPARVKEEVPEVADASAQVVEEVDLFAPTPDQLPPRNRSGSAEPYGVASNGGNGSALDEHGGSLYDTTQQLHDFKLFRKQGAQMPALVVEPLPVFLVDNFHNEEEAEAMRRQEEERATKKRRADEAFKTADVGAKKLARTTRRP